MKNARVTVELDIDGKPWKQTLEVKNCQLSLSQNVDVQEVDDSGLTTKYEVGDKYVVLHGFVVSVA